MQGSSIIAIAMEIPFVFQWHFIGKALYSAYINILLDAKLEFY